MRAQKLADQGLTHSLKKAPGSKKRKKHAITENGTEPIENAAQENARTHSSKSTADKPSSVSTHSAPSGIKHAATAKLTARVLEEENEKKKRRKMLGANENLNSLFTKGASSKGDVMTSSKSSNFMSTGHTVPAAGGRK